MLEAEPVDWEGMDIKIGYSALVKKSQDCQICVAFP